MQPMQAPVTRHDAADSFAFTASAYGGAIRLRASGRRTLVADHHEHQLHIHLVALEHEHDGRRSRRGLRANKSGSATDFLAMAPDRRAGAVARVVERARFPPGGADAVAQFCEMAARAALEKGCDDVTVTVGWTPTPRVGEHQQLRRDSREEMGSEDARAGVVWLARRLCKQALRYVGLLA